MNRNNVDAIEKIVAEHAFAHLLFQILVGRDDHPHVHLGRHFTAHRIELPLLQHAQKLGLSRKRHVADFVQEQRAAMRLREQTLGAPDRARECALFVSKQLAFEQRLGHRGAVHSDERFYLSGHWQDELPWRSVLCRYRSRRECGRWNRAWQCAKRHRGSSASWRCGDDIGEIISLVEQIL